MKDLIEYITRSLVDSPDRAHVTQTQRGGDVHLQVRVSKEDMGRIIGKNGRVANAVRILLNVAAVRQGKRAIMDIEEPQDD